MGARNARVSTPGYQATTTQRDPTAVMGARSVAWLVDAVLFGLIMLAFLPSPISMLATEYENTNDVDDPCATLQDSDDVDVGMCLALGDSAYVTEPPVLFLQFAVEAGIFLIVFVVWQGYTGMTPGKALLGVRAVGEDGQPPGMGKAFVRSFLWIIDGIPFIVPAVGFVTGLTSTGHRRVGDMAASTYVVSAADAGQPISAPGYAPGYSTTPSYGYGTPGYGQAQPQAGGAWGAQQQPQQTGYPSQPPTADAGYGAQSASPYGAPAAQPTSPYQMPAAQPSEQASPYGTPAAQPTEPASPYGTPAAQPEQASPYGTPAAQPTEPASPYGTPAEPASPYGTPAAQPSEPAPSSTANESGWPFQATPSPSAQPEPEPAAPAEPEPAEPTIGTERPVTWPPVVPSPESIGMPGAGEPAAPSQPAAPTPAPEPAPATPEPAPEPSPPEPASEAAGSSSPFGGLADYMGGPTPPGAPEAAAETSATAPAEPETAAPGAAGETGSGHKPQWDAARGAYIQWDPTRQSWLQWDDTGKEWKVI